VTHHVALSVVGADRLPDSGYFRAKLVQEKLIKESPIPYSIVHATQFFEFSKGIADAATVGNTVHLAPVLVQPMAAEDVARALCGVAAGAPLNGTVDIAGPEQFRLDQFIAQALSARNDPRVVVADAEGRYFGARLGERTLVPAGEAQIGETYFNDWLARSSNTQPATQPLVLKENEFRLSDVPPGSALRVGDVAVYNVAGQFYATQAKCTHKQGELSAGKLDGATVTCPKHGAQFNVISGAVLRGPATDPLKTYEVVVDGEIGRVTAAAVSVAAAI
jgi:nitrite reductase/ring-hydroxylating ferredoxin subunit